MSGEGDSIRDSLVAAVEHHAGTGDTQTAPAATVESAHVEAPAAEAGGGEQDGAADAQPAEGRDDKGRYATRTPKPAAPLKTPVPKPAPTVVPPGAKPPAAVGAPGAATAQPEAPKPGVPPVKAPQSWTHAEREVWANVPPEAQRAILRREREADHALKGAAQHRQIAERFNEVVSPYLGMIQAEGGDPFTATASVLQTAAALRTAPPLHKAHLIASLVHQFAIPIDALDAALAGQAPTPGAQGQTQPIDPDALLRQAEERVMQRLQQQGTTVRQSKAQQELQAFVDSGKAEFIDDPKVRSFMSALLGTAGQQQVALSLEDAYNQAVRMHPELSQVLKQRESAQQATATAATAAAATQRAKAAAASVRTTPASPQAPRADDSIRGSLLSSIQRLKAT